MRLARAQVLARPDADAGGRESLRRRMKNDPVTFGDISANDDAVGPVRGDLLKPRFTIIIRNMIQVRIGNPNQTHDSKPMRQTRRPRLI